jgi:hypothetical protein
LGVNGGRFHSMTSTAAHPTWPLRQPSWIWLPSIIWRMPASTDQNFFVAHWGSSIFTIFHFSLNLIFHIPTDNFPLGGICHALRSPRLQMHPQVY